MAAGVVRNGRSAAAVAVTLLFVGTLSGCGGNRSAKVPPPGPSPTPKTTLLAPGVRVSTAQLQPPQYSVSASHPLPSGISALQVVEDVQIDNLLENIAIERQDPALLQYADSGDWLVAERAEIAKNKQQGIQVVSITDHVTSLQLGFQADPNNPSASAAAIVAGQEIRVTRGPNERLAATHQTFDAVLWLLWSAAGNRYVICDTAVA